MLFMSRLHPSKGLLMLVDAIAQLRPTDWQVTIAGPDEAGHRQEVENYASRHGVSDWFEFIGDVQGGDKWSLLKSADLFVLPSHSENFGLVVAEALYAGVPVVTTSATPWQKVEEYRCGWICQPEVDDLTRVLGAALKCSDDVRREMGARGARWAREEFAGGKSVAKHVELYERVVSGAGV
jgi:glycosyltransferase involved in cell wall biosynthesis